ncbi:MAG: sodium:proton exchanger [Acidimicrobiales bacterium]
MTTTDQDLHEDIHPGRQQLSLVLAIATTVPGIVFRLGGIHVSDPIDALIYGMSIIGAAFLLSWAAEAAQLDISAGLAIAVLAFIAVLPEYAVDLVFAIKGGNAVQEFGAACQAPGATGETNCALALANMTGANRLLIGVGWTAVVFMAWWRYRGRGVKMHGIKLNRRHSVELSFLAIATMYSLTLPLKKSITLVDAAILVAIFIAYTIRISRAPAEEPHLVGPARWIGSFSTAGRRGSVIGLFFFAATVILLTAEHFAEALVNTGATLGISEFFLVQWLAPLASEAPELLVALLYAYRLNTNAALGTLVSSKVNQWTLLVGTLPIAFAIASGSTNGLPLIARQRDEVLLTAAQSFFAVTVLLNLEMSVKEAWALFTLFWAQFILGAVVPAEHHNTELVAFSIIYVVIGLVLLARRLGVAKTLLKDGIRTPYSEMGA